jgi:hypothetical protein
MIPGAEPLDDSPCGQPDVARTPRGPSSLFSAESFGRQVVDNRTVFKKLFLNQIEIWFV